MPKNNELKKILVIGSGPIVIGQAAEFDYAGTQACQALKEEGYRGCPDQQQSSYDHDGYEYGGQSLYRADYAWSSLRKSFVRSVLTACCLHLGGQTGLTWRLSWLAQAYLERENVKLLGTQLTAIEKAEDRDLFRDLMRELEQPVPDSIIVTTIEEAVDFANEIGYPIIVRPAYTLGRNWRRYLRQ